MKTLRKPLTTENLTDENCMELLELESQLTVFQLLTLIAAHQYGDGLYTELNPSMTQQNLREMLQVRHLSELGMIRLVEESEYWHWALTARGEMAVAYYLENILHYRELIEALSPNT